MWRRLLVVFVVGGAGGGCTDKAAADYAKCVQADSAGLSGAWAACQAAVHADPNSTSGLAAAAKLVELRHKQDADLAAQVAAAQRAESEQAQLVEASFQKERAELVAATPARREQVVKWCAASLPNTCTEHRLEVLISSGVNAREQEHLQQVGQAEATRQAVAAARLKVVSKPWPKSGPMADWADQCRIGGKPPILRNIEGDQDPKVIDQVASAQAELVARADGCVHLFDAVDPNTKERAAVEYVRKSMFCCPK